MELIDAVLFDLDDTLYDQQLWLAGAWAAVAQAARPFGVDLEDFLGALVAVAGEGSDRGRIIDRALAKVGAQDVPIGPLVRAFGSYDAPPLPCYPGAADALAVIRERVPIGLVTNGDPRIQHSKLQSLGLMDAFDVIVMADALGREFRKPDPAPFRLAVGSIHVDPSRAVYIGDHPERDVAGAMAAGIRAVRVRTGEYARLPDEPVPWMTFPNVVKAVRFFEPFLPVAGRAALAQAEAPE